MTGIQLTEARKQKAWNQRKAASRLGVSQPYLSLLERGERPITEELARKAARIFRLSPVALPLKAGQYTAELVTEDELASDLAMLGYPPFSHLGHPRRANRRPRKNPAEVLASALRFGNLDSRLTEALPWVALRFPALDWPWLVSTAKLNDLQNRLGFVT
ncbi:MAG: helix-turn-helix domain-containing protein, partial [Blastocatellia bacterium]